MRHYQVFLATNPNQPVLEFIDLDTERSFACYVNGSRAHVADLVSSLRDMLGGNLEYAEREIMSLPDAVRSAIGRLSSAYRVVILEDEGPAAVPEPMPDVVY